MQKCLVKVWEKHWFSRIDGPRRQQGFYVVKRRKHRPIKPPQIDSPNSKALKG